MKRLLSRANIFIGASLVLMTIVLIYMPIYQVNDNVMEYLNPIMYLLIISGLIGLIMDNKITIFTSFLSAALLALFLKNASYDQFKRPVVNNSSKISVAYIDLNKISTVEDLKILLIDHAITTYVFQGYNQEYDLEIKEKLSLDYVYSHKLIQSGENGKAIYSKNRLLSYNTISFGGLPGLATIIQTGADSVKVVSVTISPFNTKEKKNIAQNEIIELEKYLARDGLKKILIGNMNQTYWSHELNRFRNKSGLLNSRRTVSPLEIKIPHDHIFYSPEFECYQFNELYGTGTRVGSKAYFQIKTLSHAKRI